MLLHRSKLVASLLIVLLLYQFNAYGFEDVDKARSEGREIVFIDGDSITEGAYFWHLVDKYPQLQKYSNPVQLLNQISIDNNLNIYFKSLAPGGLCSVRIIVEKKIIKENDAIVLQDAGQHPQDIKTYQAILLRNRYVVHNPYAGGLPGLKLFFTTTYDEKPDEVPGLPQNASWSVPIEGGVTMNQVIMKVAMEKSKDVPSAGVIDVDHAFKKAKRILKVHNIELLVGDRVHYNVLGNVIFAKAILEGLGYYPKNYKAMANKIYRLDNIEGVLLKGRVSIISLEEMNEIMKKIFQNKLLE
ncbi:MAG: hypothetical protein HZB61_01585 [Nitrospirae bacterium]|nr:hypothetical protein [Nitrospirota bacterium]